MRIKEYLSYNPDTGAVIWIKDKNRHKAGTVALRKTDSGYGIVMLDRVTYRLHQLAFYFMTGYFPMEFVDHIDGDKSNNKWSNLRECTKAQNGWNVGIKSTNTSGSKGVSWRQDRNKWRAYTRINGRIKHLGYFDDVELADLVAQEARNLHHGEFSRHA